MAVLTKIITVNVSEAQKTITTKQRLWNRFFILIWY